jgi:hypothetical protein
MPLVLEPTTTSKRTIASTNFIDQPSNLPLAGFVMTLLFRQAVHVHVYNVIIIEPDTKNMCTSRDGILLIIA